MPTITVPDDGSAPAVKRQHDAPQLVEGGYYVYRGVSEDAVRLWSSLDTKAKNEIQKRANAEKKDIREVLESMIHPMPDAALSDTG